MDRRQLLQCMLAGTLGAVAGCSRKINAATPADLARLDCIAQSDLVVSGALSAGELTAAAFDRINAVNPKLNAVIYQDPERALARAATAKGPLAGVPYLIKDLNAYRDPPLPPLPGCTLRPSFSPP